ncbi:MAG TPA: MotA/TolQ/ExbB proton channel family protein [Tepidisphaeraceae bacterium]|jgi:biopolymer transport protein ExbB
MRRFASSKFRIVLVALIVGVGMLASTSLAQATGADAGTQQVTKPGNVFTLIMGHLFDPVLWTIAALSIWAVTLIIQGFIKNRAVVMLPEASNNHIRELIAQKKFKELIEFTETDPSFVSKALNPALKRAPSFSSMKEAMETAIGEQTAEQFRKIEYLNIIGNLGPLLGLLGTVLGMIEAFEAMHAAGGSAKPSELAFGISTALTHTFLGLFLAVPCLFAFGILRTIVDRLTIRGSLIAEEMLLMVKPAEAKPAGAMPAAPRAMPAAGVPQPALPAGRKPAAPMPAPVISG